MEPNWISLFEACWRGDIFVVFENGVQFLEEEKFQGYNISLWNKLVIQRRDIRFVSSPATVVISVLILELINRGATDINGKNHIWPKRTACGSISRFCGLCITVT